jgi:hypothetical protein
MLDFTKNKAKIIMSKLKLQKKLKKVFVMKTFFNQEKLIYYARFKESRRFQGRTYKNFFRRR